MFSKIDVNGSNALPVFNFLKENSSLNKDGKVEDIPWNFAKFVVDRNGKVIQYYHPKVHPDEFKSFLVEQLVWKKNKKSKN